ncbi:cytochrome c [Hydrogenophaga sp. 5NK40-0174]|uniref:c-type cytochrome n=1 Tax=Hydrogenophaga sp. 5NK40-0174 TaxID=3127649 RepID=UPI00310A7C90
MRFFARSLLTSLVLALPAVFVHAEPNAHEPSAGRQQQLVRMVRQDCGSCHGMKLTGGLGPALTPEAIGHWPEENLTAVIYQGRPGTPMPGWRGMLTENEAAWIASRLRAGFPHEE